ncbi:MAG: MarC family protein [Elusimicrobia bacterium]|nr:MarC family protein [Elusimicrobiota bacterium]
MRSFLLSFIPLFVAIDPLGTLPLFLGLTEGFSRQEKNRLALQAVLTALGVGICFGAVGHYVFIFLGITGADFKIAGGVLLLIFSIREVVGHTQKAPDGSSPPDNFLGMVPLGIPLIAGPAMITTLLILHDTYPFLIVIGALAANLMISLILFVCSDHILRVVGEATSKVAGKVIAIFLAAIGVMMIRKGIEAIFLR